MYIYLPASIYYIGWLNNKVQFRTKSTKATQKVRQMGTGFQSPFKNQGVYWQLNWIGLIISCKSWNDFPWPFKSKTPSAGLFLSLCVVLCPFLLRALHIGLLFVPGTGWSFQSLRPQDSCSWAVAAFPSQSPGPEEPSQVELFLALSLLVSSKHVP